MKLIVGTKEHSEYIDRMSQRLEKEVDGGLLPHLAVKHVQDKWAVSDEDIKLVYQVYLDKLKFRLQHNSMTRHFYPIIESINRIDKLLAGIFSFCLVVFISNRQDMLKEIADFCLIKAEQCKNDKPVQSGKKETSDAVLPN